MASMIHWEYKEHTLPEDATDRHKLLMRLGDSGWELVSVDNGIAYLKRQAKEPDWEAFGEHMIRMHTDVNYYLRVTRDSACRIQAARTKLDQPEVG